MSITDVKQQMTKHFQSMVASGAPLFEVSIDKDILWNEYLEAFPTKYNGIYRVRREHDCGACRQFIKNVGAVVTIIDGAVTSIWDFKCTDNEYKPVIHHMANFVKSHPVSDVYINNAALIGINKNFEKLETGEVITYEHFYLVLPNKYVNVSNNSIAAIKSAYRSARDVFKRSLDELTEDSVITVLELINSNTLYKGQEWQSQLQTFLSYKQEYDRLTFDVDKNNFSWENSVAAGPVITRIRNHSIGQLLIDISNGVDLDEAVRKYERIVAPTNYKRPNAIFTQKMLDDAKQTVESLGYKNSLYRRFANLDDINVNNILFVNRNVVKTLGGDVFDSLTSDIGIDKKKFDRIDEIPIEKFIADVLPNITSLEILLENKHANSMVSLITAVDNDAPSMFKWNNAFSWAYAGNITDSDIRQNVKSAGGSVTGVLRFSIQWNDTEYDANDLDAHCIEPNNERIYFAHRRSKSNGVLDVDIIRPSVGVPAVENITWDSTQYMQYGTYLFAVNCYSNNGGTSGFRAEIEFDGTIYTFNYNKVLRQGEHVHVANVIYTKDGFSITEKLPSTASAREIWGLKTQQFVPVSVVMKSPNYWDNAEGIGHEHIFFMLKDCINNETPNGFYNEFLKHELDKHKRVFEALGSKMKVQTTSEQLSGVGFSITKRDEIIVRVSGHTERILKVRF